MSEKCINELRRKRVTIGIQEHERQTLEEDDSRQRKEGLRGWSRNIHKKPRALRMAASNRLRHA
jgi:hypothetical protein